ncbi:ribosomal protein L11 methyltransferase [Rubidibacter lacunae KORDI 51-2]|uniref:Ribosomal protein L11 methyltransferase n=1 Tax=Rubidibacter lacunae KORDI 51-2 TaxID=582515 RepID=U5DKD1_9CHRO|nr:50S ribosomal protein L11 methyltransferase [Rubidibacter lacunae]ERN40150.1 ribosomal protein L11 methyltransferase [Rubidibacter lacunae KORDI 51-2]
MGNSWWEIEVICDRDLEDALYWRLERFGCRGTASTDWGMDRAVRAYLPAVQAQLLDLSALALWLQQDAAMMEFEPPDVRWRLIDDEDWARSWQKYWQPLEVGDRFLICPAWLTPPETDRLTIRLDPGAAFGTGTHPTTQLCLEGIEMRLPPGHSGGTIADIGCGSGILSIACLLSGATQVYAVDTDPLAPAAAISNAALNDLAPDRLIAEQGSIERLIQLVPEECDGIVCNIIAETVLELIPHFNAIAKPRCWGAIGGILIDRASDISVALQKHGWQVGALWRRGNWCSFNIRHRQD